MKHSYWFTRLIELCSQIACTQVHITENYSLRERNNFRSVYTNFLAHKIFHSHIEYTRWTLDNSTVGTGKWKIWENYKNNSVNAVPMFTVWFFAINWISDQNIPALKNFSFQPRVERRKNHFYSFYFFYHVSAHLFRKISLGTGKNEEENTPLACYAADGSLFSSCTCWARLLYDVVCGVGFKCLFVVLLYTARQWEAFPIFAAIKVMGSSVRSWSEVNFFGANVAKGYFLVTDREFNELSASIYFFLKLAHTKCNLLRC